MEKTKLTKSGKPDKRYTANKELIIKKGIAWGSYYITIIIVGIIAGIILAKTLLHIYE